MRISDLKKHYYTILKIDDIVIHGNERFLQTTIF